MINLGFLLLPHTLQISTNIILIRGRMKKQELAKAVSLMEDHSQESVQS